MALGTADLQEMSVPRDECGGEGRHEHRWLKMTFPAELPKLRFSPRGKGGSPGFDAEEEDDQVDDEKQHDRHLEEQHPAVGAVVVEQLVKIVEGL